MKIRNYIISLLSAGLLVTTTSLSGCNRYTTAYDIHSAEPQKLSISKEMDEFYYDNLLEELTNEYGENTLSISTPETRAIEKREEENNVTEIVHVVTSKDNLWNLAKTYYRDPYKYTFIKEYNYLKSNIIRNGQKLIIPITDDIEMIESKAIIQNSADNVNKDKNEMTYIGNYKITGYDPWCVHCCSKDNGITASGTHAEVGRTIAMKGYEYGTEVYIEGYGYYVIEDTGGFSENTIDIACYNHEDCYAITNLQGVDVYLVN